MATERNPNLDPLHVCTKLKLLRIKVRLDKECES